MAYYYRKTVNNTADDIKLKIQIGALTVKITENIKYLKLIKISKKILLIIQIRLLVWMKV